MNYDSHGPLASDQPFDVHVLSHNNVANINAPPEPEYIEYIRIYAVHVRCELIYPDRPALVHPHFVSKRSRRHKSEKLLQVFFFPV